MQEGGELEEIPQAEEMEAMNKTEKREEVSVHHEHRGKGDAGLKKPPPQGGRRVRRGTKKSVRQGQG